MMMEYNCKMLQLKDGRSVFFKFTKSKSGKSFSEKQINNMIELVETYMLRFPRLHISIITDYENEEYQNSEKDSCFDGQAFYSDQVIILNQIKLSQVDFEGADFFKKTEELSSRILDLALKREELLKKLPEYTVDAYIATIMAEIDWGKIELTGKTCDNIFANSWAVRSFEGVMCIKRVLIHEIAHIIANQYELLSEESLKSTFELYKEQFENIDEFFAECFMTNEFTGKVPIANWIGTFVKRRTLR